MRSKGYDCGCVVMRDDRGHPTDVLRCQSHKDYRDVERLAHLLDTPPVLGIKVVDTVHVKDKFGGR
jgi:hypothetical protein